MSDGEAGGARRHAVAGHRGAQPERTTNTASDGEAGGARRAALYRPVRAAVTMLAVLLLVVALPAVASAAAAAPAPGAAPLGKYGATLSFELSGVQPVVVTSEGGNTLSVTGRYTNTSDMKITDLGYKFQRGTAMDSMAAIRAEAADPTQQTAVIDSGFVDLPGTLAAGASANFTATVAITGNKKKTLAITAPGVYPVMININATVHLPSGEMRARVGELHLLVTVLSVPGRDGTTIPGQPTGRPGIPLNMLWPIVDRPHLGVNGVFVDDDLAREIAPGGRLRTLVDTLATSAVGASAITLVVDPLLLDELDRMSHGYWVQAPDTTQPALTPTLNGSATSSATSPPGSTSSEPTTTSTTESTTASSTPATTPASSVPQSSQVSSSDPAADPAAGNSADGIGQTESADGTDDPGTTGTTGTTDTTDDSARRPATATDTSTPESPVTTSMDTSTTAPSSTPGTETPVTGTAAPTTSEPHPGPQPPGTVAGTGSTAAAQFLDQLRRLAGSYQVLVLPYADPDAVAMVRAGMTDDLAAAVYRGRAVASRVLQQPTYAGSSSTLVTSVAFPPDGLLDTATMQVLLSLGYSSAVLIRSGITDSQKSPQGVVPVALNRRTVPALLPDASLTSDLDEVLSSGVPDDWPSRVNLLAALLAQEHTDGVGTPMVLAPDRYWAPNKEGFAVITSLLSVLSDESVVAGTPLTDIAETVAHDPPQATLNYPTSAERAELSPDYLDTIRDIDQRIAVLGESLTADPSPEGANPADILDPLRDALLTSTSSSWRGDPDPDPAVLDTVTATLDSLYGGVSVRRNAGSYTLASSTAPLLLTVQNTLPYQVTVHISILGGGPAGLVTHDPGAITIAAGPRTKPVKIPSEVSRSGTFTVYAQLRGPRGADWGPRVPLTIASHAYGVLTLVLMLVAGGVLVLMVAFRIHQRWRARRRRLAEEAAGGSGATTVGDGAGGADPASGDGDRATGHDREGAP